MNYDEAVRYLLTLGRELAAPTQAAATKFDLENICVLAERLGRPNAPIPAGTLPQPTVKARRRLSWNASFGTQAFAPGCTPHRIWKASTSACASTARKLATNPSPRYSRACRL